MTTFEVHRSSIAVALADYQRRHGTPPPSALAVGVAVTGLQAEGQSGAMKRKERLSMEYDEELENAAVDFTLFALQEAAAENLARIKTRIGTAPSRAMRLSLAMHVVEIEQEIAAGDAASLMYAVVAGTCKDDYDQRRRCVLLRGVLPQEAL